MIPKILPPLAETTVLVTRPAAQGETLSAQIEQFGGVAIRFPTIAIEPVDAPAIDGCDVAVFVSINAVAHGKHLLAGLGPGVRIAAIGKATAAALVGAGLPVDYVPEAHFTSESLLDHPGLTLAPGERALIVKGHGGRELLEEAFTARGLLVQTREVYRRVQPSIDLAARDSLEFLWREEGIDVVTLASVATMDHLCSMLSEQGRLLLRSTPLLVVSERIRQAAIAAGLEGEIIVANAADDASIVGTLARWRTRARA